MDMNLAADAPKPAAEINPQTVKPVLVDLIMAARRDVAWVNRLIDLVGEVNRPNPENNTFSVGCCTTLPKAVQRS